MTEELRGRRIVVPETRELGQLVRMLEERGAEAIACPMIAIRCEDLVLMTGEGLRRLLGLARRIDLETDLLKALGATRKITRGPKSVRALCEIGSDVDIPADEPTTEGIIRFVGADEEVFEAYRDLIERVASNNYDAGERFDDQGRVLVTSEALGRAWARAR